MLSLREMKEYARALSKEQQLPLKRESNSDCRNGPNPQKQEQDHDSRLSGRHCKGASECGGHIIRVFILKIAWIS